jgi:uncharacterized protein (TIGR02246 family)
MLIRPWIFVVGSILILSGFAVSTVHPQSPKSDSFSAGSTSAAMNKNDEAIRKSAGEFSQAFDKGDAKAIASMWAEHGEYQDDSGTILRGQDAIEKAYTEFFKEKPSGKIDVEIKSIRFLTPDVAVEEGILHETSDGRNLPSTSLYSAIDVHEDGKWKIAQCREWGGGQDHLDDLNWLVGKWKASTKEGDLTISFAWDEKQPILIAKLSKKASESTSGKTGAAGAMGSVKVGYDPRRGQLHSWHSDEDGGHGEALWHRDGNQWVMNATGLTADGKETSAQNVLARIDNNNITWRSINRRLGGQQVPDTMPIKLTRVTEDK